MVIKNENIKVIFFDIGGVLLHIHPDRTINYLSDLTGISFEDVKSSFPEHDHEKYEMVLLVILIGIVHLGLHCQTTKY